jgi:trans-aconitate 2-methyltransferase
VSAVPRDWDAAAYDRVSTPQQAMAGPVLDRLELSGDEVVLDAGCGSGKVTAMLLDRLPHGRVIAADAAPSMVALAREALVGRPAKVIQCDLTELVIDEQVDAVFSNAVFHHIADHERLFERLYATLRPGGRVVAQCGGEGNIVRFHALAQAVGREGPWAPYLDGWRGPWHFASPRDTERRLLEAGFSGARCWLEPWPVVPDEPAAFLRSVCLGPFLEGLPDELREGFLEAVLREAGEPLELDYVRLNIAATR